MNTIVVNTLLSAVTEHTVPATSATPAYAAGPTGLYLVGGTSDAGTPIAARFVLGSNMYGTIAKKRPEVVHFGMSGDVASTADCIVVADGAEYSYSFVVRSGGESRALPGKGIRATYIQFGFENVDGADFTIEHIAPTIANANVRRI